MVEFTRKDVEDLLRLIDGSNFDELKLEMGDLKLELRRRGSAPAEAAPADQAFSPAPLKGETKAAASAPVTTNAQVIASGGGSEIPAPLLGTFYHAPKPGAEPFIKIGDTITSDTVIGVIEVMKLMNSVSAGVDGVVTEIIAADGQLVEHGQALIRVQPAFR
jgi:acetyl-CoA carboxylase biotin carboxyl carrier protein